MQVGVKKCGALKAQIRLGGGGLQKEEENDEKQRERKIKVVIDGG